jgi:methylated-DNA-[protein]-cysteine S-methyltransferase
MESAVGTLLLAADEEGLRLINFQRGKHAQRPGEGWKKDATPFQETMRQLNAYFGSELHEFDLRLAPEGTGFQREVWSALCDIPYGETISYGDLARRIRKPKAVRAVGTANGANPIPIVIPCHRVIGSDGKLTGYGGGLDIKEKLLALEQKQMRLL